jgi:hypothetical protein
MPMYSVSFLSRDDATRALRYCWEQKSGATLGAHQQLWVWADNRVQVALTFPDGVIRDHEVMQPRIFCDYDCTMEHVLCPTTF